MIIITTTAVNYGVSELFVVILYTGVVNLVRR